MKLKLFILAVCAALTLGGCAKPPAADPPFTPDPTVYDTPDLAGMNATYIKTPSGIVPISMVRDGGSLLHGENYYFDLVLAADNDAELLAKKLTAFDNSGKNLGETDGANEKDFENLLTSGNWKLLADTRHSSSADNGYKQFIFESFSKELASIDAITVTDVAEYDLDGDGADESVVTATADKYTVLAFLSQSLGNKILGCAFDNDKYDVNSWFADLDGDGKFSLVTVTGDSFKVCTVCKEADIETDYIIYLPLN